MKIEFEGFTNYATYRISQNILNTNIDLSKNIKHEYTKYMDTKKDSIGYDYKFVFDNYIYWDEIEKYINEII